MRRQTGRLRLPDLGIPLFIVNWFTQDPLKALAIILCVGASIWSLCNLDCRGADADEASDGGDGGGD
jgi:hypothetical protein